MLLDQIAILGYPRNTAVAGPVGGVVVREAYVDMLVVSDLVELVRNVIADEVQRQLRVFVGCEKNMRLASTPLK